MNASSQGVKDREKEELLFRNHKNAITFSLLNLRTATVGKIKAFIDDKIDNEIKPYIEKDENERYENGDYTKDRRDRNIKKRIDRLRMTKRAIHSQLKQLQAEKLVEKHANSEYSLTLRNVTTDMMLEGMGRTAFAVVADLPFPPNADLEEQFEEAVKRVGAYVMFIFFTSSFSEEKLEPLPDSLIKIDDTRIEKVRIRMIRHAINPVFMYHRIFYNRFVRNKQRENYDDSKLYGMEKEKYYQMMDMYRRKYSDIYDAIIAGGGAFHKKINAPHFIRNIENLKKRFPILEKEFEELVEPLLD